MKKNEPNSQTKSVFWLVAEEIDKHRGMSPYGDLGGSLGLSRGQKPQKTSKNDLKSKKIEKKCQNQ